MTDKSVLKAVYWDYKRVPTRNSFQIICEVPIEQADMVHRILGQPSPKESVWVAIAKLDPSAAEISDDETPVLHEKEKRKWEDMKPSQQAGIRCNETAFERFLIENFNFNHKPAWKTPADFVRSWCGVRSRSELDTIPRHALIWRELDHDFQIWQNTPEL